MRTNEVKRKLQRGEPSFGLWLTVGELHTTRALARCGFEWLNVDMEHGPHDWMHAAAVFAAIADASCVPLARVPCGNHDHIKRALDSGAWGIVVPMVETVEQARSVIAAAKYPPVGNRSLGGALHAMSFDTTSEEYYARANDEILVVLQIESAKGVSHADEICRIPGIDVAFVGPRDLRAQMRGPDGSDPSEAEFEAMVQRVIDAKNKAGIAAGILTYDPQAARQRAEQGFQLVGVGSDLNLALTQARVVLEIVRG